MQPYIFPYIFPYIGYYQLMRAVDVFVTYDDVQYMKGGWINRNRLLVQGKPKYITFSVSKGLLNSLINEHVLAAHVLQREKRKILSLLQQNYSKAPFFNEAYPIIENIINVDEKNVARFAEYTQVEILKYLDINIDYRRSSELDFDKSLKGQDRVIKIVKILNGKRYINPIGGLDLYSPEKFNKNGIELRFLKSAVKPYTQFTNDFIPNLSIIDVLMFNSIEKINEMLNNYELI